MYQRLLVERLNSLHRQKEESPNVFSSLDIDIYRLNIALGISKGPGRPNDVIREAELGIKPIDLLCPDMDQQRF